MTLSEKLGIKDFNEMVSDTLQSIVDSNVGITNTMTGSVVRTIVEAILDNIDASNYYAEHIYSAMNINNATGDDLDNLVAILGITRESATKAVGIVTFSTGDAPYDYDISIPYGYEVTTRQASDGTVYTYTVKEENVILTAGNTSIDVMVEAEIPGHQYLPAGALCIMGKSIIGIASVINQNEINSGEDEESDTSLRNRTKEIVVSFGKCTDSALKVAVEEIDGIINCVVIDQYDGVGTTGIIVVPNILPVTDDISKKVDQIVADTKASGIKVIIIYPSIKNVSINITITGSVDNDVILEAISDYTNSLDVGQTFIVKQMERKILNAIDNNVVENDDVDITTIVPSANVKCSAQEIIRVNNITINGVIYNV